MRGIAFGLLFLLGCSQSHGTLDASADAPRGDCPAVMAPRCVDEVCCREEAGAVRRPDCSYECPAGFVVGAVCDPAAHCIDFAGPCTRNDECALAITDCCGPCGVPTLADFHPILASRAADHAAFVCPDPGGAHCADCAVLPHGHLGAVCEAGRCTGYDVRQLPLSACTTDADCRVRTRDCCECGGATDRGSLIAVRVGADEYAALVCDETSCPECLPTYPSNVEAYCAPDGHCDLRDVP